ncbi:MAG: hypothetical protein IPL49_11020 [Saprospirales bacterium]|nr:hypothetical protein [Saprospirales bacterium]
MVQRPVCAGERPNVMDQREDFSPCFDMKDCWAAKKPGDETLYYWNLFSNMQGDEAWKVLRIEAEKEFEENRWWYQFWKESFKSRQSSVGSLQ